MIKNKKKIKIIIGICCIMFLILIPLLNAGETIDFDEQGWRLVSVPKLVDVEKIDLYIKNSTKCYTWDEAVEKEIILTFVYSWDRENGYYVLTDIFQPYHGYWMYFNDTSYDLSISKATTQCLKPFP